MSINLYADLLRVLASGDRAERALASGDTAAAQTALRDRSRDIAALPPPPPMLSREAAAVAARLHSQSTRLDVLTREKLNSTLVSLRGAVRAGTVAEQYGATAPTPTRVDTAPRQSFSATL